jgi:CTP synthase (UTP-ammonia lyase)
VENTNLIVTGSTETCGESMIEIIEYQGKSFIIGFQFHPEAATVKHVTHAQNAESFMNMETSLLVFRALLDKVK